MDVPDSSSRILAGLLEARTGQQLTMSRRWRIETALKGLLRDRGIPTIDQLITALVSGREPGLADEVVEALLNNETYWFRDKTPFDLMRNELLPKLEKSRAATRRISIWSAGCSTGQEAYSVAMLFADMAARWRGWTITIVGTDVSRRAVERARDGTYSQFEVQRGLPVTNMVRHFTEENGAWRVSDALRAAVRFQAQSLAERAPGPGTFDVILCRNVLLYFGASERRAAFSRLAEACAPDGALMLGAGETVIGQTDCFESDKTCRGMYRLKPAAAEAAPRRRAARA